MNTKSNKNSIRRSKILSEQELNEFLAFCEEMKIKQVEIADLCYEDPSTISQALTNRRFKRANAKLVRYEKKEEMDKKFKEVEKI